MSTRVIIEPQPWCGSWNMAVDEALLEAAAVRGQCTLRWYRWSEATISLGYFQKLEHAADCAEFRSLPLVRRLTGGGAILHHHELTYSCTIPAGHRLGKRHHEDYYELVHERILTVLARRGAPARLRGDASGENGRFLCFGRGDARDVVLGEHKILGSAQRRRRGAVIQHGSLLLQASEHAPQFPGLCDLVPEFDAAGLVEDLALAVSRLLADPVEEAVWDATLCEADRLCAEQLEREKYSAPDWNGAR